jgi:hypothetical protein
LEFGPLLVVDLLYVDLGLWVFYALLGVEDALDWGGLEVHLAADLGFEVAVGVQGDFVDYHGVEFRVDTADLRATAVYLLQRHPQILRQGYKISKNLHIHPQILLMLAQQAHIINPGRPRNPMLVQLLRQTILTVPRLLPKLILKDDLSTPVDLYVADPHQKPVGADEVDDDAALELYADARLLVEDEPEDVQRDLFGGGPLVRVFELLGWAFEAGQLVELEFGLVEVEEPDQFYNIVMCCDEIAKRLERYRLIRLEDILSHDLPILILKYPILRYKGLDLSLRHLLTALSKHIGQDHLPELLLGREHNHREAGHQVLRSHIAAIREVEEVEVHALYVLSLERGYVADFAQVREELEEEWEVQVFLFLVFADGHEFEVEGVQLAAAPAVH